MNETQRRNIIKNIDSSISIHHDFNYKISKSYLKNKALLDVGCWTGNFLKLASEDTQKLFGIDPKKAAINIAQRRLKCATFQVGVAEKLPYKNSQFDVVTLLEVLEHVPQSSEKMVISEINRVLKMKGVLILSTPNKNIISILGDPAYFLIGHKHYSVAYLTKLLEDTGFNIQKIYYTGGIARIITVNIELIAKHLFKQKITWPNIIMKRIEKEYQKNGFFEIHIVATKNQ
jgi:ubiquinone/menaquinone biosynthesis C-methylase UbiE